MEDDDGHQVVFGVLADGLSFPTSLAIGEDGVCYVTESGLPFGGAPPGGRIWRLETDARRTLLVENLRPPVNGLTLHDGHLYVSEGGHPARISRFDLDGHGQTVILDNLPAPATITRTWSPSRPTANSISAKAR